MKTIINMNEYVYVKLTDFGKSIIAKEDNDIETNTHTKPNIRKQNELGTRFQLYELFSSFGKYMYNGSASVPFENNVIIFDK